MKVQQQLNANLQLSVFRYRQAKFGFRIKRGNCNYKVLQQQQIHARKIDETLQLRSHE